MSLIQQHQSIIDEVKQGLDHSNPINEVLDKLDDPMDESEFILYIMLKQGVPVILQVIDNPVDASKIQKAKISDETKQEAIRWKCNQATTKVVWIHRKKFSEVTGLGDKIRKYIKDTLKCDCIDTPLMTKQADGAHPPPAQEWLQEVILTNSAGGAHPPPGIVGYNIDLSPDRKSSFFPSTALPKILESYSKKSEVCSTLNEYYRATLAFTKDC